MGSKRMGLQTILLPSRPAICAGAAVVGKLEGEGPLGKYFDAVFEDARVGCDTWEQAESALQREALTRAAEKAGVLVSAPERSPASIATNSFGFDSAPFPMK